MSSPSAGQEPWTPRQWGVSIALLAGCAVVLCGAVTGLGPELILERATIGAAMIGAAAGLTVSLYRWIEHRPETDD
ncbi:MAG: hypothetical protein KDA75_07005 [Planctomycetaceae bacterium]|nr:hypothetical protein [Planctomycetaceae bacterium]